ncbi:30S ribosomal protein S20 [Candidatus Roizmanbacteria bacterium RIFCSPHIGHO2_01_FULL_39_12b]|uniref:Small ribosomal subunit protein bS20 n=1 Tax=Candidatus Roizmanbacteria bacterium RIFCSPHIGHO2_01_FULL_39_12b TaxID=1802030 RepID=A0A1F7G9Q1_9BACT|nr:MAG: 30S ribosomal protein S20 [Candidatus Roizmanbacteria bacterium RIFCSPHIGHO2_01_FULL_39_12b]OGK45958.1 MAG: 30S ribosomal protein S20 [Candidatus Roizmanbacteria bacterium RIFCSPLOWO2_01_FULL_39_19]
MPIIKSAKKKMRQDKKRTAANAIYKKTYKMVVKKARAAKKAGKKIASSLTSAYSSLDKAAKKGIIHKKKAARLKSRIAKGTKSK